MDRVLQLNEFFVEGGNQEKSHVLLHITEPSTPEEQAKGYFFAIAEVNGGSPTYITKLQKIIDDVENTYYEISEEPGVNTLETVLEEMNQAEHPLLNTPGTLHCIIGVIRHPDIMFSYHGRPLVHLFYKTKQDAFKFMDLLADENTGEPSTEQLFSQMIQGKLSPEDYLMAATPNVNTYFDADRLQKLITSRPAKGSAEHLERSLGAIKDGSSFGGIIFHLNEPSPETAAPVKKLRPKASGESARSLTGLFSTEQRTAYTLAPNMLQRLSEKTKTMLNASRPAEPIREKPAALEPFFETPRAEINATHRRAHEPTKRTAVQKTLTMERINTGARFAWLALKFIGRGLLWIVIAIINVIQAVGRTAALLGIVITNHKNRRHYIIENWKRTWRSYRDGFLHLPLITKIIVVCSIVLALTFLCSLWYIRHTQIERAAATTFDSGIQTIKNRKDSAESSLVYNNQTEALANISAARAVLASLQCISKEQKATCAELSAELESVAMRVRKMTTVTPVILATWTSSTPYQLAKLSSKIFGLAPNSANLMAYDMLTRQSTTLPTQQNIVGFSSAAVPKENDYLALFYRNKLLKLDAKDNSISSGDLSFPNDSASVTASVIYNRRLYTLDPTDNQIYRHDSIKTGFGRGKEWLRGTGTDLKNGVGLASDGDMFALKSDGTILKFTSGNAQPFTIQGLEPVLSGGSVIWTYNDLNYIYVLDNVGKRLVILDKDGKLIKQITAAVFKNPSGLVVDEPGGVAYIADSGTLYQISLK